MNKTKNVSQEPPPTSYKFYLGSRERYIHISADFQSGNIQLIRQLSEFNYRLNCIDDGVKTKHRVNSKSWFYFAVKGFPKNTKGKFTVSRVQTLMAVYQTAPKSYRPVYRQKLKKDEDWSQWNRIQTQSPLIMRETGQLQVTFEFPFRNEQHLVEFAFAYPYTFTQNIAFLNTLNQFYCHDQFYFHKEVLVNSPEDRPVHLLTFTSHDQPNNDPEEEQLFDEKLFPEKCRPKRFKKPVVLLSGRVHPGQTAASFAMEGIINFLVDNRDLRSYLLKKMFVFMIVPMINVDGVYHGHFRMDGFGKNLNRYYGDPDFNKQPAVYAIRSLADHLIKGNRLSFYFDLHAHNAKKGAFIYGNAINDFVQQVQSQVFCKLFALNHSGFQYEYCNFSQKQMNSKDRYQERTKEGCGRVVMHKIAHIIHSYSLQCGIISPVKHNALPQPMNSDFQLDQRGIIESNRKESPLFDIHSYRQLGKAMMVSILDVFDKNPFNRVYNSTHKSMQFLRRVTAFEVFHTAQRFRMFEKYVYGKVKNINELIRQVLNSKLHYRELYNFYFYNEQGLKNTIWPENIPGLVKPKFTKKIRRFHSLQQPKMQYSLSFLQDLKANRDQLEQVNQMTESRLLKEAQEEQSRSSETENDQNERQIMSGLGEEAMFKDMISEDDSQLHVHSEHLIQIEKPEVSDLDDMAHWNTCKDPIKQPFCFSKQLSFTMKQEKHDNLSLMNIDKVVKIPKLQIFDHKQSQYETQQFKLPQNESPSVRVRRLMKNQSPKKFSKNQNANQIKLTISQMVANTPQLPPSSPFLASNTMSNYSGLSAKSEKQKDKQAPYHDRQMRLFEQIKSQIRQQLKRHKQKSAMPRSAAKNNPKSFKYSISEKGDKDKLKSANINVNFVNLNLNVGHHKQKSQNMARSPSKSCIAKTQLPALNSHILIITSNSTKGLGQN